MKSFLQPAAARQYDIETFLQPAATFQYDIETFLQPAASHQYDIETFLQPAAGFQYFYPIVGVLLPNGRGPILLVGVLIPWTVSSPTSEGRGLQRRSRDLNECSVSTKP